MQKKVLSVVMLLVLALSITVQAAEPVRAPLLRTYMKQGMPSKS